MFLTLPVLCYLCCHPISILFFIILPFICHPFAIYFISSRHPLDILLLFLFLWVVLVILHCTVVRSQDTRLEKVAEIILKDRGSVWHDWQFPQSYLCIIRPLTQTHLRYYLDTYTYSQLPNRHPEKISFKFAELFSKKNTLYRLIF